MKKSVKITIIVICSIIIALTCVGAVVSILSAIDCSDVINSHSYDDAWLATEEYTFYKIRKDVHEVQFILTLGVVICAVALITAVLCWANLGNEGYYSKTFEVVPQVVHGSRYTIGKIMNKKLLKIQTIVEIACLCIGIACYFIMQFVTINNDMIAVFAILLIPQFFCLIAVPLNIFALTWQYKKNSW